ncbi:MAG: hypothetical protein WCT12_09390 [Verrucomicrobiota bacterium]
MSIVLPTKWIAARMQIDTTKDAKAVLHHLAQAQRQFWGAVMPARSRVS